MLFADVREQRHEAGSLDGERHSVLAHSGATGLATVDDLAVTVDELLQELEILVIDEHRTWTFTINEDGILLLRLHASLRAFAGLSGFRVEGGTSEAHGNLSSRPRGAT